MAKVIQALRKLPLADFAVLAPPYILTRLKQTVIFAVASVDVVVIGFNRFKQYLVRRMFWGRGSLYKTSFHLVITVVTSTLLVTGILSRVGLAEARQSLDVSYGSIGNNDLLAQGGSLTSVLPLDLKEINYSVNTYRVREGDSLSSISKRFGISKDTIKWANPDATSPYNDDINVGANLLIPEIDGVLYQIKSGDTLDKVVELTKGNRFDIIELNRLVPPNYRLKEGSRILIPGGRIAAPTPPPPVYYYTPTLSGSRGTTDAQTALKQLSYVNPLGDGACAGYIFIRGISPWHSGIDLSKGGGCPVRAVAGGTVIASGWGGLAGQHIVIDHGNGVHTHYYHASQLYVSIGQEVKAGQTIMYMGTTGNSTGIHLHIELRYNGQIIDPGFYIPY